MRRSGLSLALAVGIVAVIGSCSQDGVLPQSASTPASAGVLVLAHRGASGYRPEHTLAAYRLAWAALTGVPVSDVRAAFYYVAHDQTVRPADLLDEAGLAALIEQVPAIA